MGLPVWSGFYLRDTPVLNFVRIGRPISREIGFWEGLESVGFGDSGLFLSSGNKVQVMRKFNSCKQVQSCTAP